MMKGYWQTLINSQVDGTTLTAAAAATAIPAAAKKTLVANYFDTVGQQLIVRASGRLSTAATTPGTIRLDVRFGGTAIFDTLAIGLVTTNAYTTVGWWFEAVLTLRVIGASANFMGQAWFTSPNVLGSANVAMPIGGVNALTPWNTAPAVGANFDSTASQQIDFFFTQTVATGSFTVHQFQVIDPS